MFEICKYSVWISYLNLLWSANPVTLWIDFISSSNSLNHFENNIPHFKNILQFPPTYIFSTCIVDIEQSCTECKMDHTSESCPGSLSLSPCNYPTPVSDNCSLVRSVGWVTNALRHATQRKYWSVRTSRAFTLFIWWNLYSSLFKLSKEKNNWILKPTQLVNICKHLNSFVGFIEK